MHLNDEKVEKEGWCPICKQGVILRYGSTICVFFLCPGFCFERLTLPIWKILDPVVDYLLGDLKKKLVFIWDISHCTNSSARSLENCHKFIVFKKLGKIWEGNGRIASENGYYDELNTLLLDDSPYKALLNPKHTGIFPLSYTHKDINDNSLGPDGDLRVYLESVASSENVKTYVQLLIVSVK
ncbi:putative FCP1 domain, HAD superfamily protein [Helianthus anomalus]